MAIWGTATVLLLTGHLGFVGLLVTAFLSALMGGLFSFATDASLRSIVTTRMFPAAQAANEGRNAAISLAAGPLGGFLYGLRNWIPFAAPVLFFAVTLAATFAIRTDLRPHAGGDGVYPGAGGPGDAPVVGPDDGARATTLAGRLCGVWHGLVDGLRWSLGKKRLMSILGALAVVNFGLNLVLYTINLHLIAIGEDPWRIGLIDAAIGISVIAGSLVAARLVNRFATGPLAVVALAWFAVAFAPLMFTQALPVVLTCCALAFASAPIVNAGLLGYLMSQVPTFRQARVMTFVNLVSSGLAAVVPLLVGLGLQRFPAGPMVAAGVAIFAASVAWCALNPRLREIPGPEGWADTPL